MRPLDGKSALITGASAPRGIGRAIALRLAADGAAVAVADMGGQGRLAFLQELVAGIEGQGGRALAVEMDVTRPDEIAAGVAAAQAAFGGIDILVNNAGSLAGSDRFMATTPDQWQASFEVNILGPMRLCQAVIPGMQARGAGRIVTIGSTGSLGAEAGFGAYTAMKHALVGMTKTLAAEFGGDGILCNTVCPGFIATDMHEAANARLAVEVGVAAEEIRAARYKGVPLGAAGTPMDVAAAVAYLAGPGGDYVTGVSLPVAGGVSFGI